MRVNEPWSPDELDQRPALPARVAQPHSPGASGVLALAHPLLFGPVAVIIGFVCSGVLLMVAGHPLFNLNEHGRFFRRVEFSRDVAMSARIDIRPYLMEVEQAWTRNQPIDANALQQLARSGGATPGGWSPPRKVLAHLGAAVIPPPYQDPYRLPFVVLPSVDALHQVLPALAESDAVIDSSGRSSGALSQHVGFDLPTGGWVLSPGLALRFDQAWHELRRDHFRFRAEVVVWLVLGGVLALLTWLFFMRLGRHFGQTPLWFAIGVAMMMVGFYCILPGFQITRGWNFDPANLSPAETAALYDRCRQLLADLERQGSITAVEAAKLAARIP